MAVATWVGYPKSYSAGRNRPPQYVVVHYTAGSEGPTSAEAGAAYDKRRADGTSTHVFADSNSLVREVPDGDRAHAALFHGNEIGLQLEICGTAQTRAQWLDAVSLPTLRMAARQTAEWCRDHGIPPRRLSVAETRAAWYNAAGQRPKGICGHVDVTNAYPEDRGSHTDPGTAFPWDVFLAMVVEELGGAPPTGDDMTPEEHAWAYTTLSIIAAFANGSDVASSMNVNGSTTPVSLTPYWTRLAASLTPAQLAAIGAAAQAGAEAGAPTQAELEAAAFAGAQRAEDE